MAAPLDYSEIAKHVFALEGKTVLYIEKLDAFRVSIADVRARAEGFEAVAKIVSNHGLVSKPRAWVFGAAWA